MVPITVTSTIDHTEVPSDTAASSSALTWPVMATSATPMPTVASWPTSIGQDRRHKVEISVRTGEAVLDGEVVLVMSVL
ncbi:hypothetical protein MasN3_15640 [Massilia varians]|uniref:Uncharacterized protein n=1 Tax=Massilia varians TaxID=457921 RepID=A0ABN6TAA5_9BURK|nr:hypothetical protein MasN3_15640 [Massilia varians]